MGEYKGQSYSQKKKRIDKRDKKRSMNYKKMKRENKHFDQEEQIIESHIPYNYASTKSPHILINKWIYRLQKNCIVLKNPSEQGD